MMQNASLKFIGQKASLLLLVLGMCSCATVTSSTQPVASSAATEIITPQWSATEIENNLRSFNNLNTQGRETGAVGFSVAGEYVAARMKEFFLQPVSGSGYSQNYQIDINRPGESTVIISGKDSTILVPVVDYLPDGRTAAGAISIREVAIISNSDPSPLDIPVFIPTSRADLDHLKSLEKNRAKAVFVVGPPVPNPSTFSFDSLLVLQVTENAAKLMLNTRAGELVFGKENRIVLLNHDIEVTVNDDIQIQEDAQNYLGFMAGKDPVFRKELVVVCADLDGIGTWANLKAFDLKHPGKNAAAVVEMARVLSIFANRMQSPSRTVLFALWSGGHRGHAGFQAWLERPFWERSRIHAVYYLGIEEDALDALMQATDLKNVTRYAVNTGEMPSSMPHLYLRLSGSQIKLAETRDSDFQAFEMPDFSTFIDSTTQKSVTIADKTYSLILSDILPDSPFRPRVPERLEEEVKH